jgi:hypothetical protein
MSGCFKRKQFFMTKRLAAREPKNFYYSGLWALMPPQRMVQIQKKKRSAKIKKETFDVGSEVFFTA